MGSKIRNNNNGFTTSVRLFAPEDDSPVFELRQFGKNRFGGTFWKVVEGEGGEGGLKGGLIARGINAGLVHGKISGSKKWWEQVNAARLQGIFLAWEIDLECRCL